MNWNDRITVLSVNPDAATTDEVARLAAELMEARRKMTTGEVKIYCSSCGEHQPLEIERMRMDENNGKTIWGGLVCSVCHLVIAALTVPNEGRYEFLRVD